MSNFLREYRESDEEEHIRNWDSHKAKMNKSLSEYIQNLSFGKSSNSRDNSIDSTNLEKEKGSELRTQLNENSSTGEFKQYLEDLKKSYLEKLTLSCPPKLVKNKINESIETNQKLKSVENLSSLSKNLKKDSSIKRNLFSDELKHNKNFSEFTDLIESQENKQNSILEKNVESELSNTQILSRLVQIREYLKQAYTMLTTLQTSNNPINYSAQMNKLHSLIDHLKDQEKGYMDLLNSFSKFQQFNSTLFTNSNEDNKSKLTLNNSLNKPANKEDDSEVESISGSFISDTLTLNNNNVINEIFNKYRKSANKSLNPVNDSKYDQNELIVVGKGLNKSSMNETFEDEKTENDQDLLDFEDSHLNNLIKNSKRDHIAEQREEIMRQMSTDLDTLEQLKEQKQLLKSIRLRKEELKALEGRRKALEALQKIANDGEQKLDEAFNILPIKEETKTEPPINPNSIYINRGVMTDPDSPRKPMTRKTFKPKETHMSENLELVSSQTSIEPSSQIEKSKITAKHYEDLIRNILSEKYSQNLVKPVSSSDLVKIEQSTETFENSQKISQDQKYDNDTQEELRSKLNDLAEHEKKLDELYQMQSKLANLKTIINHFNGLKDEREDNNLEYERIENENDDENNDHDDNDDDDDDEQDPAKKELIEIHKQKLISAKEKLRELQDLISRLQVLSDESGLDVATQLNIPKSKIHEYQQIEANKALNYLNDIERQRKEDKLEELKRNKQKLLEILHQKDQESIQLENIHSHYSDKNSKDQPKDLLNQSRNLKVNSSTNDVSYLNEIESNFKSAENGFDILSAENLHETGVCHSPSDVLWSQMKKQLNMRENLRNKKKELEDIIRDEYNKSEEGKNNLKTFEPVENFDNDENNEILNGYRDFFLRKRLNTEKKAKLLSEFFDQERMQQENICPPDELIQNGDEKNDESDSQSSTSTENEEEDLEEIEDAIESKNYVQMNFLNQLDDKIENLFLNQKKMNQEMFKNFSELIENNMNKSQNKESIQQIQQPQTYQYQTQFQTQLQIQQLMFNLNTAYHEISTQRTEIARLNEQMTSVNKQLSELAKKNNSQNTVGINTECENRNDLNRTSVIAALPSYFYNRKKTNTESNYYTDDFEELDEDEEKKDKLNKKNSLESRTESSLSSSSKSSSSTSTFACRKSLLKQKVSEKNNQRNNGYKSISFEKMREQIYSEVATLISQNESRPFYLLNLFKELQFIRDKNARDQVLKSIFNISNRQTNQKLSLYLQRNYSTTDSNLDDEEQKYLSKRYESQKEADDEESSQTPFESDSLSNTVIFVKNSPRTKPIEKETESSGSSILGVEENFVKDQENIGNEVKRLISQIISLIKNTENFESDDEDKSTVSSTSESNFKNSMIDLDYLNEIIDKVLNVLRQSAKHYDYTRFYENQLSSYLKEALRKYEGKLVIDSMEDILIEISDILYNELTFYSTMNKTKMRKNNSEAWSNAKNFSDSSTSRDSSENLSEKIEKTEDNFKKSRYQSIELLKHLSSILNNKFGDLKSVNDRLMDERLALERDKLESLKYDLKKEFENITQLTNGNDFVKSNYGQSSLKYLHNSELESSCCGEENYEIDQEEELEPKGELPFRILDINDLKDVETNEGNKVTLEDLPIEMKLNNKEEPTEELKCLDKIIMDSISDGLVGDADGLNELLNINNESRSNMQSGNDENHSLKSDSSNSDHFVIITGSNEAEKKNEENQIAIVNQKENETDLKQGSTDQDN